MTDHMRRFNRMHSSSDSSLQSKFMGLITEKLYRFSFTGCLSGLQHHFTCSNESAVILRNGTLGTRNIVLGLSF